MIDTSKSSQGKETYNFIIYSADKLNGTNNNGIYNVDWSSLLKHFPENQKFRIKWSLSSVYTTSHGDNHTGALFIDFGSRSNQQDTKGNNSINHLGFFELSEWHNNNSTIRHAYENTYITITKPVNSQIGVILRLVDNSSLWTVNGTNQPPDFCIKIELQPIYEE
jgi:hypothetical protein